MIVELEDLKKELSANPKDSFTLKQLGWLYLRDGYYKQARDNYSLAALFNPRLTSEILIDYERALDKDRNNLQARLSVISLLLSWSFIDEAVLELEELLDVFPDNLTAFNILGRIYIKQERLDDTLALLSRAISLGIKDTQISEMLASVYLEKGMCREAISFFEELPPNKNTLRTLAELYARTGDHDRSAEKYYQMFQSDPEVASEVIRKLEELAAKNGSSLRLREIMMEIYGRCMQPDNAVAKLREILNNFPEKLEEVTAQLKKILKNYPGHPEASLLLAEVLTAKGSYSESIEEYTKLIKGRPQLLDRAIEGCREILKKYPEQFLARQFLVDAYISQDNLKDALQQMKAILEHYKEGAEWVIGKCKEISRHDPGARIVIGYAYLAKGDYSRAALEAESVLSTEKGSIPALNLLGSVYINQGLSRKAVETFNRALELDPYNLETQKKYGDSRKRELLLEAESIKKRMADDEWKFSLHLDLAKIYNVVNQREDALREAQIATRDMKRSPFAYLVMAELYHEEGRFDLETSILKKGLEIPSPDLAELLKKIKFQLALSFESQGLIKKSIEMLEEILQEDFEFPNLADKIKYLKSSSLSSIQNKMLAAIPAFFDSPVIIGFWGREAKLGGKKQTLNVSFGQNYNASGLNYFARGMNQAAQEEFTLCAQLDPNFSAGVNNLGVTHLISKRYDEALHRFRDAFDIDPASAVIASNMGLAYYLLGNAAEAQKWLEKSIAVSWDLSSAHINLGDLFIKQNQAQKAIESYRKVSNCDILYSAAQRRLWGRTV
ncbi:MAG TPA: tetratricopeptide repeat protein [Candidatus Omnitrophota bacterium]|nr:tetratricopeptide repeat protein [Candidatus Omnitrophota bacterium]